MRVGGKRLTVAFGILVAVVALAFWFCANLASPAVQIAFLGYTNFGNRAVALFAITNQLTVDVQGTAYLQTKGALGWRGHSLESQKKRAGWVGPVHGVARSVMLLGIARPSTTNEWRVLISFVPKPQGGFQQARQHYADFLTKRGFPRLGAWVQPHARPEYAFGPEMKA